MKKLICFALLVVVNFGVCFSQSVTCKNIQLTKNVEMFADNTEIKANDFEMFAYNSEISTNDFEMFAENMEFEPVAFEI